MSKRPEKTPHQRRYTDGNKHMKRCATSQATENPRTAVRSPPVRGTDHMESPGASLAAVGTNMVQLPGRQLAVPTKLSTLIPPSNGAPWYLSSQRVWKLRSTQNLHTMFIATLWIIFKLESNQDYTR